MREELRKPNIVMVTSLKNELDDLCRKMGSAALGAKANTDGLQQNDINVDDKAEYNEKAKMLTSNLANKE